MAATITQTSTNHHSDEDYIDMEVSNSSSSSSSSTFLFYSISSPPQTRDFEFQMSSTSLDKETTSSPADELFYKGKLLPLHLPPRLQMVQKLLQNEENFSIIPFSATPSTNCSISPSESCRVSCELNPDECFFDWSREMSGLNLIGENSKKSWGKRLKEMKGATLGQKLKASRAFIRSLFSKSACSVDSCAKAAANSEPESLRIRDCLNKYSRMEKMKKKKNTFGRIDNERYKKIPETVEDSVGVVNTHRRSFSGAISAIKYSSTSTSSSGSSSSSSSFSFSSNGFHDLPLKRSSSANSELESSIEGAIAHCKQSHSQQISCSRKTVSDSGLAPKMQLVGGTKKDLEFTACEYDVVEKGGKRKPKDEEKERLNVRL